MAITATNAKRLLDIIAASPREAAPPWQEDYVTSASAALEAEMVFLDDALTAQIQAGGITLKALIESGQLYAVFDNDVGNSWPFQALFMDLNTTKVYEDRDSLHTREWQEFYQVTGLSNEDVNPKDALLGINGTGCPLLINKSELERIAGEFRAGGRDHP